MASRPAPTMQTPSRHGSQHNSLPQQQRLQPRKTTSKPLNFQQAMSDFGVMFPEIDRNVIETVLRANNGVVQTTIDQLLELQESTIVEQAADKVDGPVLPSYEATIGGDEEPPPAYSDIWEDVGPPAPDPLFPQVNNNQSNNQPPPPVESNQNKTFARNRFWGAPIVGKLPNDFLRLDGINQTTNSSMNTSMNTSINSSMNASIINNTSSSNRQFNRTNSSNEDFMTDDDIERFLEDEKLALFLQNEEFLRELRRNREFVTSLEADHQQAIADSDDPILPPQAASGGARPRTSQTQEDAQFKQKLKHMGKSTRKKFGKMAKKFSRTKTGAKPSVGMGMTPSESRFNLLEEEEPQEEEQRNKNLYHVDEENYESEIDSHNNISTERNQIDSRNNISIERNEEPHKQRPRPRPSVRSGRQLPQPPGAQPSVNTSPRAQPVGSGNVEPIVFYSEDNEFSYKND